MKPKIKYGLEKKYSRWQFGIGFIVLQLLIRIVWEGFCIKVGGGGYTGGGFLRGGFFVCAGYLLVSLFVDKFLIDNGFDHSLTDQNEVRIGILRHNRELFHKIKETTDMFEKREYREKYWWYRKDLTDYLKTHKLNPGEKDYANGHLKIGDKISKFRYKKI